MKKLLTLFFLLSISFLTICSKNINIENGIAEVNGTKLYYEVAGSGTAIVLIHGNGGDCRHWDYQFESFAQNYKVIRYDVRGFGKSALPVLDENYSYHDDLKALLQHLGVSKAHICGLSMGCGIAVDFALAYPEMCSSLIAVGPWAFGYNSQAAKEMFSVMGKISSILTEKGEKAAYDYWIENPVFKNSFKNRNTVAHMKKVGYDYSFWHFTNKDPNFFVKPWASTQINKISLPILIITSEYDLEACKEVADLMEQNIKESKKVIITDAGHCMNIDKPSEFNKIVLGFFSELSNN